MQEPENKKRLWRQGDVLIQECGRFPDKVKRKKGVVLVHGETSGHTHRIADKRTARIYKSMHKEHEENGTLFLEVFAEKAEIVHPEHHTIPLEKGLYRIWRQREFVIGGGFRIVAD
jgi:hypothetical protein